MPGEVFPRAAVEAKHRKGFLGAHYDCFVDWMNVRGYSISTMRAILQSITLLGEYLQRRGIRRVAQLETRRGQRLLIAYRADWKSKGCWRRISASRLCMRALQEGGILSVPKAADRPASSSRISRYASYLSTQKGLSSTTVGSHIYWTQRFLRFLGCPGDASRLPSFQIADVDRFVEQEGRRLRCGTQQILAGVLRAFLRFLFLSAELSSDLSSLVTSPRRYRLQSLPAVLEWQDVQKIVETVDVSTKAGLQHYAILLLLTTYGLRAGEVARLRLDDINWRDETIHIAPGKTGKDLYLPLTAPVGNAIFAYLRDRRPASQHREIFLLTRAPWTPLKSCNIGYVVRRHIKLADFHPLHSGPHLLRHSFATHLVRQGASLKEVGDLLGHRNPDSTHTYTKTATNRLREVALEVPEVNRGQ
jgi:site-specific recombinase XerD